MPRKKLTYTPTSSSDRISWLMTLPERIISFRPSPKVYIILLIALGLLLAFYKKEWFVAATVNGTPITNLELLAKLNQQFRGQTLNQMINEKIILDEARKSNIAVSDSEIEEKLQELENQVGGAEVFESLLAQQGQTRNSVKQQIRLQLIIEKLYQNEATVSAQEIDQFLQTSSESLQATDSAAQRKEAQDLLKQQKINQVFSQKFQELRQSAKIQIF
ncbi:hypothetical protein A3B45_02390 [Candidatus Daviesbacteria bacterium RIFCSPLOWO2_01_FULL_39_12]|uniref:peptidylprolyl isomerase n=1 Tax=Candidatus Daviesbacteria bacterium RIFCSPLOWO2_01_FULL_39_12 TaxID=1797785 RepID=A0A1F5KSF8_9BACT|nr:MAG: hypothetical protein A3D79_00805 [Candidatus Daviesbacteria bacterium RIFCSPHIGHO2_02_FULL_39_8]OGE43856.1 MAG: hypothetical protein A3B45_02390 [Candidatus Daviesbacteria bacterium RIFCSPLOWO2_01_FULL_39_12]